MICACRRDSFGQKKTKVIVTVVAMMLPLVTHDFGEGSGRASPLFLVVHEGCSGWVGSGRAEGFPRGFRIGLGGVSAGFPGVSGGFRMCLHFQGKHGCYVWPGRRGVQIYCKNHRKLCR